MFLIGDKVVHPMHGAGVIERITSAWAAASAATMCSACPPAAWC